VADIDIAEVDVAYHRTLTTDWDVIDSIQVNADAHP
jgi:hypothetical protein